MQLLQALQGSKNAKALFGGLFLGRKSSGRKTELVRSVYFTATEEENQTAFQLGPKRLEVFWGVTARRQLGMWSFTFSSSGDWQSREHRGRRHEPVGGHVLLMQFFQRCVYNFAW